MADAELYKQPDIRTQAIDAAMLHLEEKRARRMVVVMTYKEKLNAKLDGLDEKAREKFAKQVDRVNGQLEQLDKRMTMVIGACEKLAALHNDLNNIAHQREDRL